VDVLFLSGCAPNLGKFREQFDFIVLLSTPADVMVDRLTGRTSNSYGKHPEEVARSLHFKETIEPRLRSIADLEVDTSAPLEQVVADVLKLAPELPPNGAHDPHDVTFLERVRTEACGDWLATGTWRR
jgi:hypothetical protein